jgi:hypothetical protein
MTFFIVSARGNFQPHSKWSKGTFALKRALMHLNGAVSESLPRDSPVANCKAGVSGVPS